MSNLNLKKKKIFLIFYISLLIFSSLGSINTFYKFIDIESISSDNDTKNDLNTAETFIYTLNGKKYLAEYITREKVKEMKEQIGIRDPNKNYNQIIDGHGTGYAPPTEESLEKLIGKISLLDEIRDPLQSSAYRASKDLSGEIYFPTVGDQMYQGSCAAWANVYYAYGYLEAKDYGWDASSGNPDYLLSPAWSYNKVAAFDYGSMPTENGLLIQEWGCATMTTMPYNDADVDSWGDEPAWREAPYHRPLDFTLITYVGPSTIDTIKSLIDGGTPVTFGINASQFSNGLDDITEDYILSSVEYDDIGYLNHAQCIVGYDDSVTEGSDLGAFRVVNSWGDWMDSGYYWFTYDAFNEIGDTSNQEIIFFSDRIDYNPSLIATWEFAPAPAPTRMDDIITLGVGPHDAPLDIITPHYDNDVNNLFPEFMALDISEFQSYYDLNNDVLFYLELRSSHTPGIISSFRIERYISGVLQEITSESPDVPRTTPGYVYGTFMDLDHELKVDLEVPTFLEIDNTYTINATVTNTGINDETDVNLFLYLDNILVDSIPISYLPVGTSDTINYMWIPTEYGTYNFTAYAPSVPDEIYIENNIVTELISIKEIRLFDGMFINYTFTIFNDVKPSNFTYSYVSGDIFHVDWDVDDGGFTIHMYWDVDTQTRIMENSGGDGWQFGDGVHTPIWIFTDVSLGDEILIAVDGEGDHLFSVTSELIYYLPDFGLIEAWELEDLDFPGGVAWYEKSTGILLNGTFFYYLGGEYNYTFDFIDTNIEFTYAVLLDDFELSSNAGTPDRDGTFDLTWEVAEEALNYSVYEYFSYITEINGSLKLLVDGTEDLSLSLSGYSDGTYYFIVVANKTYGGTLSNCIKVVVEIGPPDDFILSSNAGTPDKDGVFKLTWTSANEAHNYSVYESSSYVTEINGSLIPLIEGTEDRTLPLSGYSDGTYYFIVVANNTSGGTLSNCIEVVVEIGPPDDFILSSNAGTPDDNGAFDLTWEITEAGQYYSLYEYSSYITEINGGLIPLIEGTTDRTLSLSSYSNGTYYFIAVAHNAYGDTLSNCIEVVVQIPPPETEPEPDPVPEPPFIPGYNLYVVISLIGIVSIILFKKRFKLNNN